MSEIDQIVPLPGYEPEIGRWMWALEETRRRTLRLVDGLDQRTLDWKGADGLENSIGSLLYHLALVEMSWLFFDILQQDHLPASLAPHFPHEMGDAEFLTHVPSVPLAQHLARLERSRTVFLDTLRGTSPAEWRRLRGPADEQATPEWVVFHLVEHEAGHAFQIGSLKRRAASCFRDHL